MILNEAKWMKSSDETQWHYCWNRYIAADSVHSSSKTHIEFFLHRIFCIKNVTLLIQLLAIAHCEWIWSSWGFRVRLIFDPVTVFILHCRAVYFYIWSMCNMRFVREDECSLETCQTHHTGAMSVSHSLTGCYLSGLLSIRLSVTWTQAAGNVAWWCSAPANRHLTVSKLTDTTW